MACQSCKQSWFFNKLGRCNRCIQQLFVLVILSWLFWFTWGQNHVRQIETVAVLCFALGFHLLLLAHLWMKWFLSVKEKK